MDDLSISLKPAVTQKAVAYFGDQLKVAGKSSADFRNIDELKEFVGGNEDLKRALDLVTEEGKVSPLLFYATFLALQQEIHPTQQYLRSNCEHFTPEEPPAGNNKGPSVKKVVRPSIPQEKSVNGYFDDGKADGGCY